jgi:hypothetical protein
MSAEQSVNQADRSSAGAQQTSRIEQNTNPLAHERLPAWPPAENPTAAAKRPRSTAVDHAAGELLQNLRRDFDRFVVTQLDSLLAEHTSYGLGRRGFEPVNCAPLLASTQGTLKELLKLDRSMQKGSVMSVVVRDVIVETQSLLRTFLLDFSEMAPEGELNRSALSAAVGYCIDVSKGLGKLALGLEQARLQMRGQVGAA